MKGDLITIGGANRRKKIFLESPFEDIFNMNEIKIILHKIVETGAIAATRIAHSDRIPNHQNIRVLGVPLFIVMQETQDSLLDVGLMLPVTSEDLNDANVHPPLSWEELS